MPVLDCPAWLALGDIALRSDLSPTDAMDLYRQVIWPAGRPEQARDFPPPQQGPHPTWAEALPDTLLRWGVCCVALRQWQEAKSAFSTELALRPTREWLGRKLPNPTGEILLALEGGGSPVFLDGAVMRGSVKAQTVIAIAACSAMTGDRAEAVDWMTRGLFDPRLALDRTQQAYLLMEWGETLRLEADSTGALTKLEEAMGRRADLLVGGWAMYEAARIHLARGTTEEARILLRRMADTYPTHPKASDALYNLGYSFFFKGELPEAQRAFQALVSRYPDTWEAKRVRNHELPDIQAQLKRKTQPRSIP